jgi:hypothetical protein
MMRRGQIVVTDVLTAFAVFIMIADATILLWDSQLMKATDAENRNMMEEAARAASNQLMSPGNPSSWQLIDINNSSLHSFGLTSSSNVIEWSKIQRIGQLNGDPKSYSVVKEALGLDCCEAWFQVLYENGTAVESFGNEPPKDSAAVSIDRKAILNSSPVTVRLEVWR